MNDFSEMELRELNIELQQIDDDFAELNEMFGSEELNFSEESSEELSALDAALEGADIPVVGGSSGQLTLMAVMDGEIDEQSLVEQGWTDWVRDKAKKVGRKLDPRKIFKGRVKKMIRKIVRLVKKYRKLSPCVPGVTKAVVLFKARKYGSALTASYSAYRCIRSRL